MSVVLMKSPYLYLWQISRSLWCLCLVRIDSRFEKLLLIVWSVYASYLVFQLWSHTHYYEDSKTTSNKLTKTIRNRAAAEKRPCAWDSPMNSPPRSPYTDSFPPSLTACDVTFGRSDTYPANVPLNKQPLAAQRSTIDLSDGVRSGDEGVLHAEIGNPVWNGSPPTFRDGNVNSVEQPGTLGMLPTYNVKESLQPQLSWTMTLLLLTAVTIVSF
jgi:Ca2+:H+ antiporter